MFNVKAVKKIYFDKEYLIEVKQYTTVPSTLIEVSFKRVTDTMWQHLGRVSIPGHFQDVVVTELEDAVNLSLARYVVKKYNGSLSKS